MQLAEALRDQELDQVPEELATRITGERFEQAIRVHDLAARVHKHHGVRQCLKQLLDGHGWSPLLRRWSSSVDALVRAPRWTLGISTGLRHRGRRYLSATAPGALARWSQTWRDHRLCDRLGAGRKV